MEPRPRTRHEAAMPTRSSGPGMVARHLHGPTRGRSQAHRGLDRQPPRGQGGILGVEGYPATVTRLSAVVTGPGGLGGGDVADQVVLGQV
jgi:hypothetical protein